MLPYEDVLDYTSFAIFFSEKDVLDHPDMNIFDILAQQPESEIKRLQRNGQRVKRHFVYHEGRPEPGDAFDMLVSGQKCISRDWTSRSLRRMIPQVRQLAQVSYNSRRLKNMLQRASYKRPQQEVFVSS